MDDCCFNPDKLQKKKRDMPNDEMKPIRDAIQAFYEKTGIRITDMDVWWTDTIGSSNVIKVQVQGQQP